MSSTVSFSSPNTTLRRPLVVLSSKLTERDTTTRFASLAAKAFPVLAGVAMRACLIQELQQRQHIMNYLHSISCNIAALCTRSGGLAGVIFSLKRSQPPMETKQLTRSSLPSEAIELYNLFIHGVISRRAFMDGVKKFAVGGVAVAAIVEALMPQYAQAQQVSKTDDRIKCTYETVPSPQGNGSIKGYFVRPVSADTRSEKPVKLPGILVIHENRGLNPHIED